MRSRPLSLSFMGLSSALSATITWLVLLVAARKLGVERYTDFLVVWGVYFGVLGVLAGLQQEVTRAATRPGTDARPRLVVGSAVVAMIGSILLFATSPAWAPDAFGGRWPTATFALCVCFLGYAAANLINGVLSSRRAWSEYALLILAEAGCRAVGILVVLRMDTGPLGWGIAIATGLLAWVAVGALSPQVRSVVRARGDVSVTAFVRQLGHAIIAAGCSSLLVAGFPALFELAGRHEPSAASAVVLATVIATRAPVLIFMSAFQGPLIAHLVRNEIGAVRVVGQWLVGGLITTALATVAAFVVGPALVQVLFGDAFEPSAPFVAVATIGAALLAGLTLTGWLALALGMHRAFVLGWVAALALTVGSMSLGIDVEARAGLALVAGPAGGLLLHAAAVRRRARGGSAAGLRTKVVEGSSE